MGTETVGPPAPDALSERSAMAFCDERCLPDSVRGPVEWAELARLMAARRASIGFAQNGARRGTVPGLFCGARRALCASVGFARNEGVGGLNLVRPRFCGLASVGRDPLRLALFDLGLLLPFVHLGHWDSTAGDVADRWPG